MILVGLATSNNQIVKGPQQMTSKLTEALAPLGGQAKLYQTAAETLRAAKLDVSKALAEFTSATQQHDMLSALRLDYLNRVAADMRYAARTSMTADAEKAEAVEPSGHADFEVQKVAAGGHPLVADADEAEVAAPPGQFDTETRRSGAGGHPTAIEADEAETVAPPSHLAGEAHSPAAGGHPLTTDADEADTAEPPGQNVIETQTVIAGGRPFKQKRVKVHAHTRSPAQKAAAKFATAVALQGIYARQISGKPIGEWTFAELHGLQRSLVQKTAGFVQLGTDTARDTLLVTKILHHAQVVDPEIRVMDAISPDKLAELDKEAISEAPVAISITMQATAAAFAKQLEIDRRP